MLPYQIVENKEFKEFVLSLNKHYSIQQAEYIDTVNKIEMDLKNATFISSTLDLWSSVQNYSYLGVTAHNFDENDKYCNRMIGFKHMMGRHTSEMLELEIHF